MTLLPEEKFELVTPENLHNQLATPLVFWERWMMGLEIPQYPGSIDKSGFTNRPGFITGGNWRGWKDADRFPHHSRDSIPAYEIRRGLWRRPLSPSQIRLRESKEKTYASEHEAMVDFFQFSTAEWKGFKPDDLVDSGTLTLSWW